MAEMRVIVENPVSVTNDASTTLLTTNATPGEDSISATGAVPNIVAGEAVCSLDFTIDGFYEINVHRAVDGTGTPSLYNNGNLVIAGATHNLLSLPEVGIIYEYTFYASLAANANTIDNLYIYGGTAGATVTFTAGASGTSFGQVLGVLL